MNPKITVMIPTFNQEEEALNAVRSALDQDWSNLEVMVSDDCSTDRTFDRLSELSDPRLRLSRNPVNIGRTANYRKLLYELASGDWVVNLDGDDWFTDPSFLSTAARLIRENPDLVLVGAGCVRQDNGRSFVRLPAARDEIIPGLDLFLAWEKRSVPHLGAVYPRDKAVDLGFYQHDILSSDWESILRLLLHGRAALLAKPVGVWRFHRENASRSLDFEQFQRNLRCAASPAAHALSLGLDPGMIRKWEQTMLATRYFYYLNQNLLALAQKDSGQKEDFRRNIRKLKAHLAETGFCFPSFRARTKWLALNLLPPWLHAGLYKLKARLAARR